jgi:hypothetical protein
MLSELLMSDPIIVVQTGEICHGESDICKVNAKQPSTNLSVHKTQQETILEIYLEQIKHDTLSLKRKNNKHQNTLFCSCMTNIAYDHNLIFVSQLNLCYF